MTEFRGGIVPMFKGAWKEFGEDECGVRAAALAYYTVFALPPLLILLVMIAGRIWSPEQVQHVIQREFTGVIGQSGGEQIRQMMVHGRESAGSGVVAAITSVVGLVLGATGALLSLQAALNRAWEVKPDPRLGGFRTFITKRLLTLGMVLGLGFLLAVSLALTAGISALGATFGGRMSPVVMHMIDLFVSSVVLIALFAALFKVLPDAEVGWRDVWMGATVTGLLFVLGKFAIGVYLVHIRPGDAFGAAGALAVVLVWAYYAGMILMFGAEFTHEWATHRGEGIVPSAGAVQVAQQEVEVRDGTGTDDLRVPPHPVR